MIILWCLGFFFLTANSPEDHPRIGENELVYLTKFSCKNQSCNKVSALPPTPWRQMLSSRAFWALAVTHYCSQNGIYMLAITLPLFINEVFMLNILEVKIVLILLNKYVLYMFVRRG